MGNQDGVNEAIKSKKLLNETCKEKSKKIKLKLKKNF